MLCPKGLRVRVPPRALMRKILSIIKTYKIGAIFGVLIVLSIIPLSMWTFGYTAGCPEFYPCNQSIMIVSGILYDITTPFLLIGASIQSLLGLTKLNAAGVLTPSYLNIIPFLVSLLLFLIAGILVGIGCEVLVRKLIFSKNYGQPTTA